MPVSLMQRILSVQTRRTLITALRRLLRKSSAIFWYNLSISSLKEMLVPRKSSAIFSYILSVSSFRETLLPLNGSMPAFVSWMSRASVFFAVLLTAAPVAAQVDSQQVTIKADSQQVTAKVDSLQKKNDIQIDGLVNIVPGNKKIRAYGWGEYRVKGRCLCCDNTNDGDCIVVHNIERTDRERISQIVDGTIEGDTGDNATYFGNTRQREHPDPVTFLMVDISLGKMYEIRKVIVYTMVDEEKRTNFLPNCEFGYYDQFSRLQWTGRVESKKYDEPMTFDMEHPVFTKSIMLRVKGGKSRITEVAIWCEKQPNAKP